MSGKRYFSRAGVSLLAASIAACSVVLCSRKAERVSAVQDGANSIDSLLSRYSSLSAERQRGVYERVSARVDSESGLGEVYRSVLDEVHPVMMRASDFEARVGRVNFERDFGDSRGWRALYAPHLDVVLLGERGPVSLMRDLLEFGESERCVLAHEALHKVQNDESHVLRVLHFLSVRGYISSQGPSGLALSLDRAGLRDIGALIGSDSEQDVEQKVRRAFLAVQTVEEVHALYEVGARCLLPRVERVSGGLLKFNIVSGGGLYHFSQPHVVRAAGLVVRAYGKASLCGGNVDIEANRIIGRNCYSFCDLESAVSDGGYFSEGSKLLLERDRMRCEARRLAGIYLQEELGSN